MGPRRDRGSTGAPALCVTKELAHGFAGFHSMDIHWSETSQERRERFLRLAIAAAVTAAKIPIPKVRAAYLTLAQTLKSQADDPADE